MAAPNVTSWTVSGTAGATSYSANWPATVASGDLLVVVSCCDGSGDSVSFSGDLATNTLASGGYTNHGAAVTYLIAAGTEGGGTFTVTHSSSEGGTTVVARILAAEWHGSTAPEVAITDRSSNDWESQAITPSGWNPATDDNETLVIGFMTWDGGDKTISGYPTELPNDQSDDTFSKTSSVAGLIRATADLGAATLTTTEATNVYSSAAGHTTGLVAIRGALAGGLTASGTPSIETVTASGVASLGALTGSGTPSIATIVAAGVAIAGSVLPGSGTPSIESPTASGIVNVFSGSEGLPTLDTVTASGSVTQVQKPSGTPSVETVTASGSLTQTQKPSGTPSIDVVTASGVATSGAGLSASGTPSIAEITATGVVVQVYLPSGSPSIDAVTASGQVIQTYDVSGTVSVEGPTSSGVVTLGEKILSGTPALSTLTASAQVLQTYKPSGTPSTDVVTAIGTASLLGQKTASGTPSITVSASGVVVQEYHVSVTATMDTLTSSGVVVLNPGTGKVEFVVVPGRNRRIESARRNRRIT